jgi:hypothetical protein
MSEYEQSLQHGKAERRNGKKTREAARGRTNSEEAAVGGGWDDVAQVGIAA